MTDSELSRAIRSIVADEVRKQLAVLTQSSSDATSGEAPSGADFYFCPEAAIKLRRTEASVRWLWASGVLKSRVVGGRRVSTQSDLDEFFAGDAP